MVTSIAKTLFYMGISVGFFLVNNLVFAQTGPGGVGNSAGASGQPRNVLWLDAGRGMVQSGTVDSWADQSGNSLIATGTGATRPSFVASDANFNNQPVINFAATGTNKHLVVADNDILDNTNGFTLFVVFRTNLTASNYALLSKRTTVGTEQSYMTWVNAGQLSSRASANTVTGGTINNSTTYVGTTVLNGAATTVANFVNGTSAASGTGPASIPNNASNLYIGAFDVSGGETRNLDGRIAEVLVYTSTLNAAQRQIVENYLAAKYGLTIGGDVFVGDVSGFDFGVLGIGRNGGQTHTEASSAGLGLATYNGTVDVDGEFLLAGHDNTANAVSVANLGTGVEQRWARTWYIDKTTAGTLDAAISFDFSDGIAGQFPQNKDDYELLRFNGSTYEIVSISSGDKSISGDKIIFRVENASLTDGIYTLGTTDAINSPVNGASNRTWYSYQTGNWTNPTSWTLDGGVIPLYVNPSSETPAPNDNVVITSGRTISMTTNGISGNNLEVDGILNVATTSGHSFANIAGTGRIRLAGASGADNFPAGSTSGFANATTGGTVEIYGTGMVMSNNHEFNDLIINLTSGTVSLTAATTVLNGDFEITQGTFRFNDGSSGITSTLTVRGNTTVSSTGGIAVSTSNLRHQYNLYGNFTNDGGTVQFTNRVSANYTAEATNGIVDFNLLSSTSNQSVICNGITRFYRIKIDKGTDDTYLATFTANAAGNFLLFGYSNEDHASVAQLADTPNAFALLRGTAEIGTNISIPVLSNTGNYNISAGATLWVNGGTVLKNNGNSLVPYGKVRVSAGTLEARVNAGITMRDNGSIIVDGSTAVVNTNQIRTSVLGVSNVGGYSQTAGTVTVDGGGPGGSGLDYYVFSLTYTGNVFQMSGGTLVVKGARAGTGGTRGAILINSDPANVSVTGGTIVAEVSNGNPYTITTRAPFWNLIVRNTFDATLRDVDIAGGTSGPSGGGASEVTLAAQPLIVKGGLTIENYVNLDHNGQNINIAGNLTIQTNGDLEFDNAKQNTVTFDGEDNSLLTFLNHFSTGAGDEQRFWNLVIDKPSDKVVSLASGKTDLSGNNNNLVRVDGQYFRLLSGIFDQGAHSIRLYCDEVLNYQTLGVYSGAATDDGAVANDRNDMIKFRDDGNPTQLITNDNSVFGVVRLNSGDDPLQLSSNVKIQLLQYLYGKINLGPYNLTVDNIVGGLTNPAQLPPRGLEADSLGLQTRRYSVEDMLVTNGANSAGGLSLYVPAGTPDGTRYVFPLGIGTTANDVANTPGTDKYTPAYVTVSNVTDDGYITITPVNTALDLLNGFPNNMLQYYWNVKHTGFTVVPNVRLQFTYNDADDNSGTVTNYVPGRVVGFSTREADAGGVAAVREALRQIDFTTGPLTAALYTAAEPAAFTGTIQVFYNRENGESNWNNDNKWSLISYNGTSTTDQPGPGDVVRLRNQDGSSDNNSWVRMDVSTSVAAVIFDNSGGGWLPRLTIDNDETISLGIVEGAGEIMVEMNGGIQPVINDTDIGAFASEVTSNFIYEIQNDATYTTYSSFPAYPNLRIEGSGGTVGNRILRNTIPLTINRDLRIDFGGTFRAEANVTIGRDINLSGGGNDGGFEFGDNGSHRVSVADRIRFQPGGNNRIIVRNNTPSSRIHTLAVGGNIEKQDGTFDLYNGTGANNNAILEITGTANASLTVTGGSTPDLFRLVMNKGTDITSTFSLNDPIVLNGTTNTATKAIELQKGLLIVNEPTQTVTLSSGGGDFSIPASAGLEVRAGTVNLTGSDTGLLLDGYLLVSGGTVNIDDAVGNGNNFIEYSASGSAILEVTSGTLTVGSQVRRNLTSTAGILKYRQSGGAMIVGRRAAPTTSRGVFEVVNNGSEFTHTGGTLTVVRGINSTTVPSLLLEPETPTIFTNSSIIIGSTDTPAGVNGQNIGIKAANRRLGNLTVSNTSGNNPRALIYSSPLQLDGVLTIESGSTFNAKGLSLFLRNDLVIDGEFVPESNTVLFTPSATRTISGTGILNFYNFTKTNSSAATLILSSSIVVENDLRIQRGILDDNGNAIELYGNAYFGVAGSSIAASHQSDIGGRGIVFIGIKQQQLSVLRTSGLASLGTVTINNPNGVVVPDQADKITINTELRLENGVFDIGGSLLTLATNAEVEEVNLFSVNNMIQTNSSFTDNGVTKNFAAGRTADFTFPVGQLLYTPVTLDFADLGAGSGSGTTPPNITVRPANERQPIVQEDVESGLCTSQIDDLNNVLQYHWIITASNANKLESNVTLRYDQSLVATANGLTEADYIAARVRTSDNTVFKFPDASSVDEASNTIQFVLNDVTSSEISGEYLAGVDCAIPNSILVYTTKGGGAGTGSITDLTIYDGSPTSIPTGAVLVVSAGDIVDLDADNMNLYRTEIEGTLRVLSGTIGNRLGTVVGTGDLRLEVNSPDVSVVLPAGFYNDFFSCTGGGLELGGNTSYEVLGGITSLRNLTLDGTGARNMANNDLTICEDIIVNGADFINANNRNISIGRDMILNAGSFTSGVNNTIEVARDLMVNGGTFSGQTGGEKMVNGDLTIMAGTFTAGSGGTLTLLGDLTVSGGTFSGGSGTHKTLFQGTAGQATSGSITLNRLEIDNSAGLSLGGATNISTELLLTNGHITPGSNAFVLATNATVTPTFGQETSFVNGRLRKTLTAGSSFTFPIGRNGLWRYSSVINPQPSTATWEFEYINQVATTDPLVDNMTPSSASIETISGTEHWKVSDGTGGASGRTATIGLSWGIESDVSASSVERQDLVVMLWNDATSQWDSRGGANFSGGNTQSRGSFNSSATISFSEQIVTLGSTDDANPLPVTLVFFNGEVVDESVLLRWITESELENDYFEVQRSSDGYEFAGLAQIPGQGTTSVTHEYSFIDDRMPLGKSYYRLKQVDFNGAITYSEVISVSFEQTRPLSVTVFPNPTHSNDINIEVLGNKSGSTHLRLIDFQGKEVYRHTIDNQSFRRTVRLGLNEPLRAGVYILELLNGYERVTRKIVIRE